MPRRPLESWCRNNRASQLIFDTIERWKKRPIQLDERKKPRSIPFLRALIGSGGADWISGSPGGAARIRHLNPPLETGSCQNPAQWPSWNIVLPSAKHQFKTLLLTNDVEKHFVRKIVPGPLNLFLSLVARPEQRILLTKQKNFGKLLKRSSG